MSVENINQANNLQAIDWFEDWFNNYCLGCHLHEAVQLTFPRKSN